MNPSQNTCPFKKGDCVIYSPSEKGLAADIMAPATERLTPGDRYVVHEIRQGTYVVVEDYAHPGGGLYWTEFKLLPKKRREIPEGFSMNETNWEIEIDEVSAGVFMVTATHASGAKYEATGEASDELMECARQAMSDVDRKAIERAAEERARMKAGSGE